MKKAVNYTKYNFSWVPRKIDESTLTVPDLVLSMAEIYRKYAVTGDISSLPGKVRPVTFDDGDEFDDSFESEEMTDTLLHAREIRTRQQSKANPASEDMDNKEDTSEEDVSTKPQPESDAPSDIHDDNERSEAKE